MARTKRRPPISDSEYEVRDMGYLTPCFIWRGHPNNKGYGQVVLAGKQMYAHRAMYEQRVGPIPEGMQIDHLCRTRLCVNTDHMEPVTHRENLMRGVGAKLTDEQIKAIRAVPPAVRTKDLAAEYSISESHMSRVRRGVPRASR